MNDATTKRISAGCTRRVGCERWYSLDRSLVLCVAAAWGRGASAALANVRIGIPVGSKNFVPEEVDHREIAIGVHMVDKVKLLLTPEPSEARKPRSFGMVLLVEKNVCAERRRAGDGHCNEQIEWKNQKHPTCDDDCGDEKVRCVVPLVVAMDGGHQMPLGIVCVMKPDVVSVEDAADPVMSEAIME